MHYYVIYCLKFNHEHHNLWHYKYDRELAGLKKTHCGN